MARKALKNTPLLEPQSLSLSLDLQARDAFFAHYVSGSSTCWDFLKRYYHPTDSPDHLTLAIEAVSLAYLWHQVYSEAALATARERYILALRMINRTLKSSKGAMKDTTLLASILLDLFEKITNDKPRNKTLWTSHVNGAFALVSLRGLDHFQDPFQFRFLERLSSTSIVSCIVSGSPVPDELVAIRAYIRDHLHMEDSTRQLSDLIVRYANGQSNIRRGIVSKAEFIGESIELDVSLRALDLGLPPSWQFSTTILDHKSARTFDLYFDSYPHRNICQARNFIRIFRIFLNESLIEYYSASSLDDSHLALIGVAHDSIKGLTREICSSVPQYVDCDDAARQRLPTPENPELSDQTRAHILDSCSQGAGHPHTPDHQADCYSLIFSLYVAGRSNAGPDVRTWVIKQLHFISNHFYIRNAEVVAQILEEEINVCPWEVYAMLGSYAFSI